MESEKRDGGAQKKNWTNEKATMSKNKKTQKAVEAVKNAGEEKRLLQQWKTVTHEKH